MQIESCIDKRNGSGILIHKVRALPTRGIKLYQSESETTTENILEYYQGPNHIVMEGFETLPFTYMIQRDGSITQWNEITWQATPTPQEPFVAVLVVGCFALNDSDSVLGTAVNVLTTQQEESIAYLRNVVNEQFKANLPIYADAVGGKELHRVCQEINSKS